jgi:hypothetical protein
MSQAYSKQILGYLTYFISALAVVTAVQIPKANAATMTFLGTGTNSASGGTSNALSASVVFDDSLISQGKLKVTLTNTGPGASVPSDVLTAIFWDISDNPTGLSLLSAKAPTVIKNRQTSANVDLKALDEWKLPNTGNGSKDLPGITQNYGIGTAGLGIFQGTGGKQMAYGIITGYDTNANSQLVGTKAETYVKDSANFVLSGLATNFDLKKINNVRFQYGTNLSEPSITKSQGTYYTPPPPVKRVPEPTTTAALGLLAVSAVKILKKKRLVEV